MARGARVTSALVIVPLVPFPPVSGSAKRTLRLLEAMERAGATPQLVTADPAGEGGAPALRERGWRVDVVHEPRPSPLARAGQHLRRRPSPYLHSVAQRLRECAPPGFVQAEHTMSSYYERDHPARRWILSTHNVDSAMLRDVASAQSGVIRARTLARADVVLCVSDADAAYFERLGGRAMLVPNGIDDELLDAPAVAPAGDRILFFGQLSYEPNLVGLRRFLAEAWPRVLAQRPQASLRVIGAGAPDRLAAEIDGARNARYAGFAEDLRAELDGAAVVVVPVWQGGGTRLKVLEALATGRPVASTTLGASGIGFRDGEHGLLADAPSELADATVRLLSDASLAARVAADGRRLAGSYRWSRATQPAEELYRAWS